MGNQAFQKANAFRRQFQPGFDVKPAENNEERGSEWEEEEEDNHSLKECRSRELFSPRDGRERKAEMGDDKR